MKFNNNLLLLTLISTCLSITFQGCNKNDDPGADNPDTINENIIISKQWKMTAYVQDPGGIDLFATMPDCKKDDIHIYSMNDLTIDEGPTKCNASDPQTVRSGIGWFFSIDGKQFTRGSLTSATGTIKTDVVEISSTKFKITYQKTVNGSVQTFTETFEPAN